MIRADDGLPAKRAPDNWGPSTTTVLSTALTGFFGAGLCATLEAIPREPGLGPVAFFFTVASALTGSMVLDSLRDTDATKRTWRPRIKHLPKEWHNLYCPVKDWMFFFNSETGKSQWHLPQLDEEEEEEDCSSSRAVDYAVAGLGQQLGSLMRPVAILALYAGNAWTALGGLRLIFTLSKSFHWDSAILISASFVSLPQPLPFLISYLSNHLDALAFTQLQVDAMLSVALLTSLISKVHAFCTAMHEAARERVAFGDLTWEARSTKSLVWSLFLGTAWKMLGTAWKHY